MAVRLVVADSNTMTRVGYAATFGPPADIALVRQAGSVGEAERAVAETRPDVVVLDVDLLGGGGPGLGGRLRAARPDLGIVLVGPGDDDLLLRSLEERFSAYLPRCAAVEMVLSAVRHAAVAPAAFTAPDLAGALARRRAVSATLSPREVEVLRHVYEGSTNARIATSLRLTESTVRTYLARVFDKLGVNNRAQAVVAASERGLLR